MHVFTRSPAAPAAAMHFFIRSPANRLPALPVYAPAPAAPNSSMRVPAPATRSPAPLVYTPASASPTTSIYCHASIHVLIPASAAPLSSLLIYASAPSAPATFVHTSILSPCCASARATRVRPSSCSTGYAYVSPHPLRLYPHLRRTPLLLQHRVNLYVFSPLPLVRLCIPRRRTPLLEPRRLCLNILPSLVLPLRCPCRLCIPLPPQEQLYSWIPRPLPPLQLCPRSFVSPCPWDTGGVYACYCPRNYCPWYNTRP